MPPIATNRVAWSVSQSVFLSVGLSRLSPAKTAELIKMPFGCGLGWAQGTMY